MPQSPEEKGLEYAKGQLKEFSAWSERPGFKEVLSRLAGAFQSGYCLGFREAEKIIKKESKKNETPRKRSNTRPKQ